MNVVILKDDFNLSNSDSEYFSGSDEELDESFNEVSDPFYEGDTENNTSDEQELNSDTSIYEQSVDDIIDEIILEMERDFNIDDSDDELKIYKEEGSNVEVLEDFESDIEGSINSFDDSDYDEEFISCIIRNTKYQLKKIIMALTPMIMRSF